MARRKRVARNAGFRKRRDARFVAIPFNAEISVSTLANNTFIVGAVMGTAGEDMFVISVDCLWTLKDIVAGEGPMMVGFSHGDLSVAELAAWADASLTDPDDIISKEAARRPARKVGVFSCLNTDEVLNDGRQIRSRIKISIGDGHSLGFWALNRSNAAFTGDRVLEIEGTAFCRWQR